MQHEHRLGRWVLACLIGLLTAGPAWAGEGDPADPSIYLRGVAMAIQKSKLGFEQSGVILEMPREGARVKKGQVIARINADAFRVAQDKAQANLANAQLTLEQAVHERDKTNRLKGEKIVSDMAVKEAEFAVRQGESQVQVSRADLDAARLKVQGCRIEAPFDGVVLGLESHVGEYVGAGTPVLELANIGALGLSMDVPPDLVANLAEGTRTAVLDERGREVGAAVVRSVMPFIDGASGLRRVIWDLEPRPGEVLAGRYLTLRHWDEQ
ncbi:MAG: efflux RND transporter periplasmic adaptor subunit [Magnetococcales bacterium]|nr:efflux RND transporter periplasmic adaptor subunit [Magnetococcales bacterium]